MTEKINLTIREACDSDRQTLANLIQFEVYVHRHLDWRQPLDWVDDAPFFVAVSENKILGAISCPTDPPHVAWVHLLAISAELPINNTWDSLWTRVKNYYSGKRDIKIAAIPRQDWFQTLLEDSGFELANQVLILLWDKKELPIERDVQGLIIRSMQFDDLNKVEVLDTLAFDPVWRISELSLIFAYRQAAFATVAQMDNKIVGYQISTASHHGGHLARLAVHPEYQRKGIGHNMVRDVLGRFNKRGARNISVNTQIDNSTSLALYEKMGFLKTSEIFPTYQYSIVSNQR
jgi:ribosomal protein S18 acetylase RimI-like enzyme